MGKSSLNGGKIYKHMDVLMEPYGKKTSDNGGFSIAIFYYWPEGTPQNMVFHMVQIHVLVGDLEPWNFMTFHMLGIIFPTDFHIFQRGWNHQPV